jgi:hypothetical protein
MPASGGPYLAIDRKWQKGGRLLLATIDTRKRFHSDLNESNDVKRQNRHADQLPCRAA